MINESLQIVTFNKSLALSNLHPTTLDYGIRNSLHQLNSDPLVDPLPHVGHEVHLTKFQLIQGPGRMKSYIRRYYMSHIY